MKQRFQRSAVAIAGLSLLLAGLALVDFLLHPLAGDYTFRSPVFRAFSILVLVPLTLLVGFLIIRRVPGNVVGLTVVPIMLGTFLSRVLRFRQGTPLERQQIKWLVLFGGTTVVYAPLRSWIQSGFDRRFFRQKYNAEKVLAGFSAAVRSETVLEPLAAGLVNSIEETLQPERISVWLVSSEGKK